MLGFFEKLFIVYVNTQIYSSYFLQSFNINYISLNSIVTVDLLIAFITLLFYLRRN